MQISGWLDHPGVADRAHVRNRNGLDRGFGQEQHAEGRVRVRGELLQLLESGTGSACEPVGEFRGTTEGRLLIPAGSSHGPAEQFRGDINADDAHGAPSA